jgi:hypothetical protein
MLDIKHEGRPPLRPDQVMVCHTTESAQWRIARPRIDEAAERRRFVDRAYRDAVKLTEPSVPTAAERCSLRKSSILELRPST